MIQLGKKFLMPGSEFIPSLLSKLETGTTVEEKEVCPVKFHTLSRLAKISNQAQPIISCIVEDAGSEWRFIRITNQNGNSIWADFDNPVAIFPK